MRILGEANSLEEPFEVESTSGATSAIKEKKAERTSLVEDEFVSWSPGVRTIGHRFLLDPFRPALPSYLTPGLPWTYHRSVREVSLAEFSSLLWNSLSGVSHISLVERAYEDRQVVASMRRQAEQEKETFLRLKPRLLADSHLIGKYVAIVNGRVEDFDEDDQELVSRIYRRLGYRPMYVGFVGEEIPKFRFPTPL